jgi:small multidrug resistance family-3 protein
MSATVWLVFVVAAVLEVGGDAMIRVGLRGGGLPFVLGGAIILAGYGVVINTTSSDFTRLLGAYVAVFATTSTLFGRVVFADRPSMTTYLGLALVLAGAAVIQRGT